MILANWSCTRLPPSGLLRAGDRVVVWASGGVPPLARRRLAADALAAFSAPNPPPSTPPTDQGATGTLVFGMRRVFGLVMPLGSRPVARTGLPHPLPSRARGQGPGERVQPAKNRRQGTRGCARWRARALTRVSPLATTHRALASPSHTARDTTSYVRRVRLPCPRRRRPRRRVSCLPACEPRRGQQHAQGGCGGVR